MLCIVNHRLKSEKKNRTTNRPSLVRFPIVINHGRIIIDIYRAASTTIIKDHHPDTSFGRKPIP